MSIEWHMYTAKQCVVQCQPFCQNNSKEMKYLEEWDPKYVSTYEERII